MIANELGPSRVTLLQQGYLLYNDVMMNIKTNKYAPDNAPICYDRFVDVKNYFPINLSAAFKNRYSFKTRFLN